MYSNDGQQEDIRWSLRNEVSDEESHFCYSESCPELVSATQSSRAELVSASRISPETLRKIRSRATNEGECFKATKIRTHQGDKR